VPFPRAVQRVSCEPEREPKPAGSQVPRRAPRPRVLPARSRAGALCGGGRSRSGLRPAAAHPAPVLGCKAASAGRDGGEGHTVECVLRGATRVARCHAEERAPARRQNVKRQHRAKLGASLQKRASTGCWYFSGGCGEVRKSAARARRAGTGRSARGSWCGSCARWPAAARPRCACAPRWTTAWAPQACAAALGPCRCNSPSPCSARRACRCRPGPSPLP